MDVVTLGTINHLPDGNLEINYSVNQFDFSGTMVVTKEEYTEAFAEKAFEGIGLLILRKLQFNIGTLIPK